MCKIALYLHTHTQQGEVSVHHVIRQYMSAVYRCGVQILNAQMQNAKRHESVLERRDNLAALSLNLCHLQPCHSGNPVTQTILCKPITVHKSLPY